MIHKIRMPNGSITYSVSICPCLKTNYVTKYRRNCLLVAHLRVGGLALDLGETNVSDGYLGTEGDNLPAGEENYH